jgi:hypothetical protein
MVTDFKCTTVKGTRDVYSMKFAGAMDVNKILKKTLTCFCCFYVDSNFSTCKNLPWTQCWEVEVLIHINVAYVCMTIEISF